MIYVVGIGPGDACYLTRRAEEVIQKAEILIGAERNIESIQGFKGEKIELRELSMLVKYLESNGHKNIAVLASGDPLIYGIGKYLASHIAHDKLEVVPGISAIQYLFSRIPLDMNDLYMTSSHGKFPDFDRVLSYPKVAMVTDQRIGPYEIATEIMKRNLSKIMIIGENLTYPDEKIAPYYPKAIKAEMQFKRNVVVILDEKQ